MHTYYTADESGWAWFIPLHKGLTSVGIVMDQKQLGIRSRASSSASGSPSLGSSVRRDTLSARTSSTLAERYLSFLELAPGVLDLIGDGELVSLKTDEDQDDDADTPVARSASDYSYSASHYAGPGWRLVGDAGCKSGWFHAWSCTLMVCSLHRPVLLFWSPLGHDRRAICCCFNCCLDPRRLP